ncbi:hypothetical protein BH23CHL5_BH23CHL5_11920 [soil metagenome]
MPPTVRRIAGLGTALLIGVVSMSGLVFAQPEIPADIPVTSSSSEVVVLWDTFDDPDTGVIPDVSTGDPDLIAEYDAGNFDIDALNEDFNGAFAVPFGSGFQDGTIAIDGLLTSGTADQPGRYMFVSCRVGDEGGGYRLEYRPQISGVILRKLDSPAGQRIGSGEFEGNEDAEDPVRLELSCQGSTITGRINGIVVVSAEDDEFTVGGLDVGGGIYTVSSGQLSVNFDNLAVSVPRSQAPTPTPTAIATPEAVIDRSAISAPVNQLRAQATSRPPIYGPSAGAISQVVGGALDARYAGIIAADFVASVTFDNPDQVAVDRWDAGLGFRQDASGRHWRVIIRSDGTWSLAISAEYPRATGVIEKFDASPDGSNTIDLLVSGSTGYLMVNDQFTAQLDLSSWTVSGDIWAGSGFFLDHATAGATTAYRDFTIWAVGDGAIAASTPEAIETPAATLIPLDEASPTALESTPEPSVEPVTEADAAATLESLRQQVTDSEPAFGPAAGAVTQGIGAIDIESASVSVENFYTTVRFSNPASPNAPDHPWDVLIGFWHTGGDNQVRVVVSSDGTWSAAEGTARPTVSGNASSILLGPARGNEIELAVLDGIGYLTINDSFVGSFAVPGTSRPGDIWIASGTFPENVQEGIDTPFSGWNVWSVESE